MAPLPTDDLSRPEDAVIRQPPPSASAVRSEGGARLLVTTHPAHAQHFTRLSTVNLGRVPACKVVGCELNPDTHAVSDLECVKRDIGGDIEDLGRNPAALSRLESYLPKNRISCATNGVWEVTPNPSNIW